MGGQVTNRYGSNVSAELIAKLAKEEQAARIRRRSQPRGGEGEVGHCRGRG